MIKEPTYSQIEAACQAAYPHHNASPEWRKAQLRCDIKAALIAAQTVDRNIYGDCHAGGGVDSIHFMTTTVEARDKILSWNHDSSTLAYHQKHTIPELVRLRAELAATQVVPEIKRFQDGTPKPYLSRKRYDELRDDDRFLYNVKD